jgi:hypothetical protein
MTRDELEHAIRAACDVAGDTELYVFGSQSVLGHYPNASEQLRHSAEVDVMPKNYPERADVIDGALGELSQFHATHGFYVHGLSIRAARLPSGWKERCVAVKNANTNHHTGWCLEGHDLAVSKLAAFRDKDRAFVRVLLRERMVERKKLIRRLAATRLRAELRERIPAWVRITCQELGI